ncbi:MAG: HAD family hydrolase [Planctomycetaceae bacterium]|nr:HAD family hydrolase [Planctomycetales bacterium]MCB9936638.1 HAD family hydrolase [Planctomycetaceae bacterium]
MSSTDSIEIVNRDYARGPFRAAIFDFDGTLSLLRRNWQAVMIPMMVEILAETGTQETRDQLHTCVDEFVMRLNGKQTIYQMIQLAEEVTKRGGVALDPLTYKHRYHDLLWEQVGGRVESVRNNSVPADSLTVPGSRPLLEWLQRSETVMYLASGTDISYVRDEVTVLGLDHFFGDHIYGAIDDYKNFSKAMIIERMIRDAGFAGNEIVGFGDGYVEIEEIKKVGGLAIGVASDEEACEGINEWKRNRLIQAGADIIIGDYRELGSLQSLIQLA